MDLNEEISEFTHENLGFEPVKTLGFNETFTLSTSRLVSKGSNPRGIFISNTKDLSYLNLDLIETTDVGIYQASGNLSNVKGVLKGLNLVPNGDAKDEFIFIESEIFALRLAQLNYVCHQICTEKSIEQLNEKNLINLFSQLRLNAEIANKSNLSASFKTYSQWFSQVNNDKINADFERFTGRFSNVDPDRHREIISGFANSLLVNMVKNCGLSPEITRMLISEII